MTKKITLTFELESYEIERLRRTINALKDFNRTTEDKADITYDIIQHLDGADRWLANLVGLEQPCCEHGMRNQYADYHWIEEDAD